MRYDRVAPPAEKLNPKGAPMPQSNAVSHDVLANAIRFLAMDSVQKINSGDPGMPMAMADVEAGNSVMAK
jgi:hypothetical protein